MHHSNFMKMYTQTCNYLNKIEQQTAAILDSIPAENLHIRSRPDTISFFSAVKDVSTKQWHETYLRRDDPKFRPLLRKYCAQHLHKAAVHSLRELEFSPSKFQSDRITKTLESLHNTLGDLLPEEFMPLSTRLAKWEFQPHKGNPYRNEEKKFPTDKGDYVRSKIECLLANLLWQMKIPYKYEADRIVLFFKITSGA